MKEKDFQSLFRQWLKYNWKKTGAFELKICKTNTFNLKRIEWHQVANLQLVNSALFYYKISDEGLAQKPYDCFTMYKEQAFVVILWYKPRQPKIFYMIPIVTIQGLLDDCKVSITEEDAKKLCLIKGELK